MDAKEKKALAESLLREARQRGDYNSFTFFNGQQSAILIEALAQYIDNLEGVK